MLSDYGIIACSERSRNPIPKEYEMNISRLLELTFQIY